MTGGAMDYTWDFQVVVDNFPILLRGVWLTVELWAVAFALGLNAPELPHSGKRDADHGHGDQHTDIGEAAVAHAP